MSIRSKRYINFIVALTTIFIGFGVNAESKDPINIEADNAKIIEKEGKSVYSGNVVLLQGNIRMTADTVIVQSSNGKLTQIIAHGKPVTYYKKNQPEGDDISGEANLLEYHATENRILLLDNARLSQGRTAFSGNRIEYNTVTDIVTAEVSKTGKERVQVIIQPDEIAEKLPSAKDKK